MRNFISEDDIEQAILQKLEGDPFQYGILRCDPSPDKRELLPDGTGRSSKKECVLPLILREALARLNPDIPGEKLELDAQVSPERLSEIHGYSFIGPVTLKGVFRNRAGIVTLEYTADVKISAECDRCLSSFERSYSFDFEHVLVKSLNSDNDEYIVTDGDDLDVDELAVNDVLLQMPTKLLCKEDCKGLCPKCGADLNISECGCE